MGNIGVQEAMQGSIAKLAETALEAPFKVAQIIVSMRKDSAELQRNRTIAQMQKYKLTQIKEAEKTGNVSIQNLVRSGSDVSKLSDLDKTCFKILRKNLDETGIKYHVEPFKDAGGNTSFSVLFEDKNAPVIQLAVEKSLKQMQDPKFMKKMQERPSVIENLKKAKEKSAEINKNRVEKHKHQEQTR